MKKAIVLVTTLFCFIACKKEAKTNNNIEIAVETPKPIIKEFGFNVDDFLVLKDTVKIGDSFGEILLKHKIDYSTIYNISENIKEIFDVRKINAGKKYTLLKSKDTTEKAQVFIYQNDKINYTVIDFRDSIQAYKSKKPVSIVEREASGIINESLSVTMEEQGLPYMLINDMADIYAWTIDFFRLQKGDRFKIVYKQRFIEDSIYAGIESIDAAYFEHRGEPFYAFNFTTDSTKNIADYFDENTKSLRRTFLKAPVQFSRISSRYNLNRRIAYYGYKVRPHRGTDFAAPIGSEILATANGTVTKASYTRGNGNYVKIKHNGTYSTQYLHMKKRNVRVGDYVKQGDVIGWVGMTGNTAGPHVCYRFWKNGRQVDPLREKLPAAESIPDSLKSKYKEFIVPLKLKLDNIEFTEDNSINEEALEDLVTQLHN
jgi:murein DD-endopeptidase MepM/ murein hydrolase activator NlpD